MIIEQTFIVQAPIQALWAYLLDIERMSLCLPGAEGVRALAEDQYEGTLKVKVGPIVANFQGKAQLVEVDAPTRLVARGEAQDARSASLASATFTATLRSLGENQTEVAYQVDLAIRGTLGKFGQGVMREVAKRMTLEFAQCVEARLTGQPEPGAIAAAGRVPATAPAGEPAPAATLSPLPPVDVTSVLQLDFLPWLLVAGLAGFIIGYMVGSRPGR